MGFDISKNEVEQPTLWQFQHMKEMYYLWVVCATLYEINTG